MGTHLTERIVKTAEIGTRKYVVFDENCAGFGLCVFLFGRKGFVLIYSAAGRQRRMTITVINNLHDRIALELIRKLILLIRHGTPLPTLLMPSAAAALIATDRSCSTSSSALSLPSLLPRRLAVA
ncbi:hypothetical protein [Cypionkella sp. TWP1-2-1b2]|uniref:hypothetical protein n=1 Tax=Cypionkella sp. TWP1-2-1b2 TaxID=2804675 RepID=UPI003CEC036A